MRRLTAVCAAWIVVAGLGGAALAQGLADVRAGNEAFRQGDYSSAIAAYTSAIRSGELVGEALAITYNNRGVAHGESGDFDQAVADYSQALALRPGDATTIKNLRVAHVRRGEVRYAAGAYDTALADFGRAIELEPEHHLAYLRRGELQAERGLLEPAIADLERAATLSPGDPEIVAALARAEDRRTAVAQAVPPTPSALVAPEPAPGPVASATAAATAVPAPAATAAAEDLAEEVAEAAPEAAAGDPAVAVAAAQPGTGEPAASATAAAEPEPAAAPPAVAVPEPAPRETKVAAVPTATAPAASGDAAAANRYRVVSAVHYRAGPDNSAARLGTVDAGRIVTVTGDTLGWKHVTLPNGDKGFIYRRWLEPVTP